MSTDLVVGSTNAIQGTTSTWPPDYWPQTYYPITYTYPPIQVDDGYANEVEVEQTKHDATLRFYRRTGKAKSARILVREVTIPLGVLEWLQAGS